MTTNRRFARSAYTDDIARELMKLAVGEVITYEELSRRVGANVTEPRTRGHLTSAMRILEKSEKRKIQARRRVGLERLDDHSNVDASGGYIKKAGRAARRAITTLACVENYEGLSREDRVSFNTRMSIAGVQAHAADRPTQKKIQAAVEQSLERLPLSATLAALQK